MGFDYDTSAQHCSIALSGFRPLQKILNADSCKSLGRLSIPVWIIILLDYIRFLHVFLKMHVLRTRVNLIN